MIVRWVAAAALCCAASTGGYAQGKNTDREELEATGKCLAELLDHQRRQGKTMAASLKSMSEYQKMKPRTAAKRREVCTTLHAAIKDYDAMRAWYAKSTTKCRKDVDSAYQEADKELAGSMATLRDVERKLCGKS